MATSSWNYFFIYIVLAKLAIFRAVLAEGTECIFPCSCLGRIVDCSKHALHEVPVFLPVETESLDLNGNKIRSEAITAQKFPPGLVHLKLNRNRLKEVPLLSGLQNLSELNLSHNDISLLKTTSSLENLPSLKVIDMSNNHITRLNSYSFPRSLSIRVVNLNNNNIEVIENGTFDHLPMLAELKLNRNSLSGSIKDVFKSLKNLKILELNRNNLTEIEGLSFKGLDKLQVLKLRHNSFSKLLDGSFFGLSNLNILQLDHNGVTTISKAWLYGLSALRQLTISNNLISRIEADGWEFCGQLVELDLSHNKLQALLKGNLDHLSSLQKLKLDTNMIEYIAEGTFDSTSSLEILDLNSNKISWAIEDMNGLFSNLKNLTKLGLSSAHIKTVNRNAFLGLEKIRKLDLSDNNITCIYENPFEDMPYLTDLHINTSSLLCDCNLTWFSSWLKKTAFHKSVIAICSYPENLMGKSIIEAPLQDFVCGDYPKPQIIENPVSLEAFKGSNISVSCKATSSSREALNFHWKKDNVDLKSGVLMKYASSPNGKGIVETCEVTLINITQEAAGKYQCVVSNSFGTAYSKRADISVLIFPTFVKIPQNVTVMSGSAARLECAASGLPSPEIAWQKDGGNDFPAARERRMHVMTADDVFFIINSKSTDMGVYSCTAKNHAGSIVANATLIVQEPPSFVKPMEDKEITAGDPIVLECMASGYPKPKLMWKKDGKPLLVTPRHFFTADDQLLVIVDTVLSDAGDYECIMSNSLGTSRGFSKLSVISAISSSLVVNESAMIGIIIMTVVCCAVGTSVIWVVVIYHSRKRIGLIEVGRDSCQYPSTLLPSETDYRSSARHLYLDTNSEHSSGKDSGTGDSAKRSSDDLLRNGLSITLECDPSQCIEVTDCLLPCEKNTSSAVGHPHRTDHDRFTNTKLVCGNCSQRWSAPAPKCIEVSPVQLSSSCSYHSLPANKQSEKASHFEVKNSNHLV